jgi:hypothetical protein
MTNRSKRRQPGPEPSPLDETAQLKALAAAHEQDSPKASRWLAWLASDPEAGPVRLPRPRDSAPVPAVPAAAAGSRRRGDSPAKKQPPRS